MKVPWKKTKSGWKARVEDREVFISKSSTGYHVWTPGIIYHEVAPTRGRAMAAARKVFAQATETVWGCKFLESSRVLQCSRP